MCPSYSLIGLYTGQGHCSLWSRGLRLSQGHKYTERNTHTHNCSNYMLLLYAKKTTHPPLPQVVMMVSSEPVFPLVLTLSWLTLCCILKKLNKQTENLHAVPAKGWDLTRHQWKMFCFWWRVPSLRILKVVLLSIRLAQNSQQAQDWLVKCRIFLNKSLSVCIMSCSVVFQFFRTPHLLNTSFF